MREKADIGHRRLLWPSIVAFLLVGYFCMGRSFAYLGLPPLHLFVGEITLALFLVFGPRGPRGRWIWIVLRRPMLRGFKVTFIMLFAFGAVQVFRGIFLGYSPLLALRDFALDYYPLFFFLGLWAGFQDAEFLPKLFRLSAWANGIYGAFYILVLNRIAWSFPGFSNVSEPVAIFGMPEFSAVILIGLISFEKHLWRVAPLLFLNSFVLLGMLIRAEWLAFVLGVLLWALLTKNLKKVALAGGMVLALLVVMLLSNFSIPGPETRGGTISATDAIGRVLAILDKDLAADYSIERADLRMYEANAVWRTMYWTEIWTSVHEDFSRTLFGYGYGYPLNELVPDLAGDATRTPHNVFFYLLAYSGWAGVAIFACFQAALGKLLWNLHRKTGDAFGITIWAALLVFALFTPFFEVPHGAIPFYLLAGCACARLLPTGEPRRSVVSVESLPHNLLVHPSPVNPGGTA